MSDTEEKKNLKARKEPTVQSNYDGREKKEENSGQEHGAEFAAPAAPARDLLTVYTPVRNKGGCSTIGKGEKKEKC
jgi:hypothetical protein